MKKGYSFYFVIGTLMVSAMLLYGMKYPASLYSPGEIVKAHEKLRCGDCHAPFKRVPSESCSATDCHAPGKVSKKDTVQDLHRKVEGQDCLVCHTDHKGIGGKVTKPIDHKSLPESSACIDCHRSEGINAHNNKYGDACKGCHTVKDWKAVSFSHERVAASPCAGCHKGPRDELHASLRDDCRECHTTKGWKPATFDHVRYFPLSSDHNVTCARCHDRQTYKKYNCTNCHEHATRGIIAEHREEGIRDFGDCLRCHRVYMNGKSFGTDRTGEGESMIDGDKHEGRGYYGKDNGYRRGGDDDDDDD